MALGITLAGSQPPIDQPAPIRLTVLISDLHFGVGRDLKNPKLWHPMEDFRWQDELSKFLSFLKAQGGTTDLILNGDTFELWQSIKKDCVYKDANLGCTEAEALGRIRHVINEHRSELNELAAFANFGNNHLYIVPGNHDAALLFKSVRAEVAAILNLSDRVHIGETGTWQSPDRLLYAEHGHQIGKDVNSWKELWPQPFITVKATKYLKRPWGEKFVQDYYNRFENKYPIIDNISEEGAGITYARAAEGMMTTVQDTAEFFNFMLFKVSRDQFVDSLGKQTQAETPWDLPAIRARGPKFLVESLSKDDPFLPEAESAVGRKESQAYFQSMSDEELIAICERRAQGEKDTGCPKLVGDLGAAAQRVGKLFGDTVLAKHLDTACRKLPGCVEIPFQTFIYSHTHFAAANLVPLKEGPWNPLVFNTGAWQRTITPDQLKILSGGVKKEDALRYIEPEDLPKCYGVVLIGPLKTHEDRDIGPRLRYWTMKDDKWDLQNTCNDSDLPEAAMEIRKRINVALEEKR
jgi:UDP-2,3-diacylglucosamine pyrophosphatase LpxH